ncbi:SpoIIE family protein phosphatase [Streptomyces sp. SL13]|uniref:protein-serine/threonine phosphatase n=1 Tax=Streptantibioticus silvisoli TaxID=2705255 RepID=A0AA90HF10_9ACTN|nr:SpoIIE family protein phosphatase [Streptantibioticus silvisoli]MDI5973747.1 SpoIIE family protein phosphatase [Streptantibioticus silvisoli]
MTSDADQPWGDDLEAVLRQIEAASVTTSGSDGKGVDEFPEDATAAGATGEAFPVRPSVVLDVGRELERASSAAGALEAVAALAAPGFALTGGVVFGLTDDMLTLLSQRGYPIGSETEFRMPLETDYPAAQAVRTGEPVYISSRQEYRDRFPATWPLASRLSRRSWAYVPLITGGSVSAVWLAVFSAPQVFDERVRGLFDSLARGMAGALERGQGSEAELALSGGLRRSMGGAGTVPLGLSTATRYVPTGGGALVGGDWFDVIRLPHGRLALVIGDVEGHDSQASILMARLRTAIHAYAVEGHRPDAVLTRADRFLASLDTERFATCLYIEADPATGHLQIARAGHPHPFLRMPDGTCLIRHIPGGLPLGLLPGENDYPVAETELRPGELMLLCTDGLIEAGGYDLDSGWDRIRDALAPGPANDLEALADGLIRAAGDTSAFHWPADRRPRGGDDIALLILRRDGAGEQRVLPERQLVLTIGQDQARGVAAARAELRGMLHDWETPDQVDSAVLLATELIGNVLIHTDQPAILDARISRRAGNRVLQIDVTDGGDDLPHFRAPGELAISGRGLMLMDALSDQCGVRPESEGKTTWFTLSEKSATGQHLGDDGGRNTP